MIKVKQNLQGAAGKALLLVILFIVVRLSLMTGEMVSSEEGRKTMSQSIVDGIEAVSVGMIKELIPVTTADEWWQQKVEGYDFNKVNHFLSSEMLPFFQYVQDYEMPAAQLVSNVDHVPVYFYEDETTDIDHSDLANASAEAENELKETAVMKGKTYTMKQLSNYDFLVKNFYIIESSAKVLKSELNAKNLLSKDLSINLKGSEPKILIYHTHTSEAFVDSRPGRSSDTVVGMGAYLTKLLEEEYGIPVYHDKTVYDIIDGQLDRNKAYNVSLPGVEKILKDNPSIEVVIDLHRDGVGNPNVKLVSKVNGKDTAQIMFFNGVSRSSKNGDIGYLKNPNKENNLAFSLQLQLVAAEKYPGLTRKIYIKGYRYNLHVKPRSLLVEVGAETSTVKEVYNAMEPLADILNDVLRGE